LHDRGPTRMKLQRTSANVERLEAIAEMAAGLVEKRDERKYSLGIEFALAELVREEMRSAAEREGSFPDGQELLDVATKRVLARVAETLRKKQIEIDLKKYTAAVREKLVFPAREMQHLADRLSDSRRSERLGAKEELVSDSGRQFVIHELGL